MVSGLFLNVAKKVTEKDSIIKNFGDDKSNNTLLKLITTSSSNNSNNQIAPYRTLRSGQPVFVHPSSAMFSLTFNHGNYDKNNNNKDGNKDTISKRFKRLPDFVIFAELLFTTKHYMRGISRIEGSWLPDIVPLIYKKLNTNS